MFKLGSEYTARHQQKKILLLPFTSNNKEKSSVCVCVCGGGGILQ